MRVLLASILSLFIASIGTQALAQSPSPGATVIVIPPANDSAASAPNVATQPPTTVVVVPPPPDYKPESGPPPRVTERDESKYGYYPPPKLRPRFKTGLLITGIAILGASYGVALTAGMGFTGGSCKKCQDIGIPLLVPVVGPFFAARNVKNGRGALIFLGVPQVIGAALAIGGYYRYRNSKTRAQQDGYVVELTGGRTLVLDVSVAPALVGPRLDLRF